MDRKYIFLTCLTALALAQSPLVLAAPAKSEASPAKKAEPDKKVDTEKKPEAKAEAKETKKEAKAAPEPVLENVINVQAEDLVRSPSDYLNKNVRFVSNFYAFSNVALDYKPAFRPQKDYFSFLVFRQNSHVPLSELKLAMKTPGDEKGPMSKLLISLKEKDEVEVTGKVFAVALDEPWMDVITIKRLKAAQEDDKKEDKKEEKKEEK